MTTMIEALEGQWLEDHFAGTRILIRRPTLRDLVAAVDESSRASDTSLAALMVYSHCYVEPGARVFASVDAVLDFPNVAEVMRLARIIDGLYSEGKG